MACQTLWAEARTKQPQTLPDFGDVIAGCIREHYTLNKADRISQTTRLKQSLTVFTCLALTIHAFAGSKHSTSSGFMSYEGRVMCGYQGWFRAEGDSSGQGWVHYGTQRKFGPDNLHIDLWPDVSEYPQTYPTAFTNAEGQSMRVFSSWDASTLEVHFRWMKEYGIDGVFMQRFFGVTRNETTRSKGRVILGHALEAAKKNGRAIAVMYDLSGLRASGEDCSSIIQDWKELVNELKITAQGTNQPYLYHRGKPLVTIWGLGFTDRPYNIRNIGIEKLIDFLKNDPEYGGCSIMLGLPAYFRDLKRDTSGDTYLHQLMASADIIMPWMVGRFTSMSRDESDRHAAQLKADLAWCAERKLDYAPCVFPGFSWYNLSKTEFSGRHALNQIPRQKGRFYWNQISNAAEAGAKMLYVAMFDEMDEATAIFKCSNQPPNNTQFIDYEGLPSDHYLWLTGQAGRMLRREIPLTKEIPNREPSKSANAPNSRTEASR